MGVGMICFCLTSPVFAQELSYDRYAPVYKEAPADPAFWKRALTHFLVYPFELIKWPADKVIVYVEKYHIDEKAVWIYDQIKNHGITPKVNIINVSKPSFGSKFDFVRMTRQRLHYPDLTVEGEIHYGSDVYFEVGSKVGLDRIAGTGAHAYGIVNYQDRYNEHFYGIGPTSSRGDGSVYGMEITTLKSEVGYEWTPALTTDAIFSYRNINISGGHDGGRGQIGEVPSFSEERVPGIHGDSLITLGLNVVHDTRNRKDTTTKGGIQRFSFSFNKGLGSSEARYFKYETELSHFFRLGSDRRVLAFHFYGEHNDKVKNRQVPFYEMAKLGGYGAYPRLSHTLRGYDTNRFTDDSAVLFNIEYRYTIWEYRNFKLDSVFFFDEGQVFREFSKFRFSDFKESYGLGFRISLRNKTYFSMEVAHGDEGTNFYVKSRAPF